MGKNCSRLRDISFAVDEVSTSSMLGDKCPLNLFNLLKLIINILSPITLIKPSP